MKTFIATLAIAAGLAAPFAAQSADPTPDALTTAARAAMQDTLGDRAKDLTVTVTRCRAGRLGATATRC